MVIPREIVATLRNGLSPLGSLRPLPRAHAGQDRPPVVTVHGYLGHSENFRPLKRRMIRAGWSRFHDVGYPSTREGIEGIVERIAATVEAIGADEVDLVGHSLGAVACRAWVKLFGGSERVRHFVSLGGPHAGTSLYWLTPAHLRPVLDPDGVWVELLSEGPEPVHTTVIRAQYDQQVFPPERAALPGTREVILSGLGHNGLLWSHSAHHAVIEALNSPIEPVQPS